MAERRVKVQVPPGNEVVEGVEVPVEETLERWCEVRLADGAMLRVKVTVVSAVRIDGRWDDEGNPLYVIKGTQTMVVHNVPDNLRRKLS